MGCQTSIAFGCIILLTSSTLFFYLYFGVYLRYKFITSGSHDSVLQVAIAFMCVCICAFVITLLLILRCLMKPNKRRTVSPMPGLKNKEGDVKLSSVVVTAPDNRIISSKKFKTRVSSPPNHPDIPEEIITGSKPSVISSKKLDKEINTKAFGSDILNKIGLNNLQNLGKETNLNNKNNTPAGIHNNNSKITGKDNILNNGTVKEVKAEINNVGKDALKNSKEIKNEIKTGAKDKDVKTEMKDVTHTGRDVLSKSDGMKGTLNDSTKSIKNAAKEVLNTSTGAIKSEVKDAANIGKDILNNSNGMKRVNDGKLEVKPGSKDVFNTSKGSIKEIKSEVKDPGKDILNKSNRAVNEIKSDVKTGAKDVLNTSKGLIKEIKSEVKDTAHTSKDVLNKSNGMKEAVKGMKTELKTTTNDGVKDVLSTSKEAIKEIKTEVKDAASTSKDILNKSNEMKGVVKDTKTDVAAGKVKDDMNTSKEAIKTDIKDTGKDILNKSNGMKGIMKDGKSEITGTGKDVMNSNAGKEIKSEITNNSGKDILNKSTGISDIKNEITNNSVSIGKDLVNKSSQTGNELKAQMNDIAVETDNLNKISELKGNIKEGNNNEIISKVTGKEASLDGNNLKEPIKVKENLAGGVIPGKKPGFLEIELATPQNVSPISDKKLYISNPTTDIKTLKEKRLKNDSIIKKDKLEIPKIDNTDIDKIDGVKVDVIKKQEGSGLNDIANAIKMGKKPGKIEVHHHHEHHKKHSRAEEIEKREKEKILATFNPCFPIPNKKRSSKSRNEEKKDKKVEPPKPIPIKLPGKTALGPFKTKAKTATAFNTAFVVKEKSANIDKTKKIEKLKSPRINKTKSPQPSIRKSGVKKLNDTFTVTGDKSSKTTKTNKMDTTITNPMTVQKAMKLDDTFTLKEKSASKEKREKTNVLGETVVIGKPNSFEKGGNAIFSVIKTTAEYEIGKAATKMVTEKVGKTDMLNKTTNLLEVPKPTELLEKVKDVDKSSNLIGKIKESTGVNTGISEAVLLYEVGKGKEKFGYWGWNYEYWS